MMFPNFKAIRMAELASEPWGDLRLPGLLDLINYTKPQRVLEIGCYQGVSTEVFLLHCAHVTAVDPWPELEVWRNFTIRCGSYPHLTTIRQASPKALELLNWGDFDLCYIDGDHNYEACKADIEACNKLATPGMWIAGHDWAGPGTPGVVPAVKELLGEPWMLFSDSSWLAKQCA